MNKQIMVSGIIDLNDLMDKLAEGERLQAADYDSEDRVAKWSQEEIFDFGKYIN